MNTHLIPIERIERKIHFIRGRKVMIDRDLAELYSVPTRIFNQAVQRNKTRFPDDFMFQLNKSELKNLRSQIVISSLHGGRRYLPYAFTEQGVAMLSSVLNSDRAIKVNIQIMRTFIKLKELSSTHKDISQKLEDLQKKYRNHDHKFKSVFQAIKKLLETPKEKGKNVPYVKGFISNN